jgi:hypothetical protein
VIPAVSGLVRSGPVHVIFAFVAMGSWAVLANRGHPMPQRLLAGLLQGVMSALLTIFLKSTTDALARRFRGPTAFWASPFLACLGSTTILVAIHRFGGTPEILRTIAVPLLVSTSYAALYNYALVRGVGR